jgi:hypothetical protein|tara:strand:+ start:173 stop:466 length:294 start_codon:yes stop_codon:yes gene_type:complete
MRTKKIIGNQPEVLLDSTSNVDVGALNIANIHASDSVDVDLYLSDEDGVYYIFKNLNIPAGASIYIEGYELSFPRDVMSLYIKLSANSSTVDVIIRN